MNSKKETSTDPLLQPLTIKNTHFRNRIMSTSHACGLQLDGFPQEAYQRYHEEKARGGLAMSMFGGSSNVAVDSPNIFNQLNVGTDDIIPYFQQFSERMHKHSAYLMCQITHLGRRAEPYAQDWLPAIAPSPIRETLHRAIPREMDEHDINRVVKAYAAAARRCYEGGLDGIETLASGHLVGQFMSKRTNHRTDKFGGSLENRMRFPLMVYEAIRKVVADDFLVGMRLSVNEDRTNGLNADESIAAARMLTDSGTVDFFNTIFGSMDTIRALSEENMPGMGNPLAPWVTHVGAFKREVSVPVFHAARISDLASARFAISAGHVDLVGMTRAHMADPHLVNKLKNGDVDQIRPCVGAQHCQAVHRPKCVHNAATGREMTMSHMISKSQKSRKAVVVGAGPGGLEAARVLAERGHNVSVFEALPEAGGQVLLANKCDWRRDISGLIDWRLSELKRLNVMLNFNQYLEADEVIAEEPDLVILATGGLPQTTFCQGDDLVNNCWDIIGNPQGKIPKDVLVYDGTGRHSAPMVAKQLHNSGARVVLASIDNVIGQDLSYPEANRWRKEFLNMDIRPHYEFQLEQVENFKGRLKASLLSDLTNEVFTFEVDQVVVDMGTVPSDDLFDGLRTQSGNNGITDLEALIALKPQSNSSDGFELHRIGDALASRNIHAAIYDALRLCSCY
jgi:2,4-dienoyl-CoA reductase-like NADH-dependent reductase (Old Yellow Enzyme family)/thioredoxin reductase